MGPRAFELCVKRKDGDISAPQIFSDHTGSRSGLSYWGCEGNSEHVTAPPVEARVHVMLGILILSTGGLGFTGLTATLAAGLEARTPALVKGAELSPLRLDLRIRVNGLGNPAGESDRALVCIVDLTEPPLHLWELHSTRRRAVPIGKPMTVTVPAGRPLGVLVWSPTLGLERRSRGFVEALLPIDAVVTHSEPNGPPLVLTLPAAQSTGTIRCMPTDEFHFDGSPSVTVQVSGPQTGLVVAVKPLFGYRQPPGAEFELPTGLYRVAAEPYLPSGCSESLALKRATPAHRALTRCLPGTTTIGTVERLDGGDPGPWQAPAVEVIWQQLAPE